MPKTRPFIDKKNSVTFNLVHRSQQDPLIVDENAPQHVLLQAHQKNKKSGSNREELHKWGIFYDDDYDYMQHLKEPGQGVTSWEPSNKPTNQKKTEIDDKANKVKSNLQLPSSVFASEYEEDEGLLRRAAPHSGPRPDLDPDIVAGLDDDFDYSDPENMLEDDFVAKAMAENEDLESGDESLNSDFDEDEMLDEVGSLNSGQFSFRDEETKSRFTEYSMSSSVMRRNEQLSLLDSRFEKLYEDYSDTEIGALDCDEIEGELPTNSEILLQCAVEFEKACAREKLDKDAEAERLSKCQIESSSDSEDDLVVMKIEDRSKEWDCESILSTYSTLYNHPRLIEEPKGPSKIKINSRTGMPVSANEENDSKLTIKSLAKFNDLNRTMDQVNGPGSVCAESVMSTLSVLSIRPKNETPSERNLRKKLLKEYRHERRIERKANTEAFKSEKKRQEKILINNRNNVQGNKIL